MSFAKGGGWFSLCEVDGRISDMQCLSKSLLLTLGHRRACARIVSFFPQTGTTPEQSLRMLEAIFHVEAYCASLGCLTYRQKRRLMIETLGVSKVYSLAARIASPLRTCGISRFSNLNISCACTSRVHASKHPMHHAHMCHLSVRYFTCFPSVPFRRSKNIHSAHRGAISRESAKKREREERKKRIASLPPLRSCYRLLCANTGNTVSRATLIGV